MDESLRLRPYVARLAVEWLAATPDVLDVAVTPRIFLWLLALMATPLSPRGAYVGNNDVRRRPGHDAQFAAAAAVRERPTVGEPTVRPIVRG